MAHFYESTLIDTKDGFQCKSYSNEHPKGFIIVKPKYLPRKALKARGLKYRFLFGKCLIRFNLFAKKEKLISIVEEFKKNYPEYIYEDKNKENWYFVVPKNKIKEIHDPKKGLQELLKVPKKDLDDYLKKVVELIEFLCKCGIKTIDLGITHSTLLGNYTPGKSDIDLIIYGKDNGWKILNYLKDAGHPDLHWKTEEEWAEYYQTHKTSESSHFTEEEYIKHMKRKKYEGMFRGNVFTLFTVENPEETWFKWEDETVKRVGLATINGIVTEDYNSHVRPGFYEITGAKILDKHGKNWELDNSIKIEKIVTYSIPFIQQAFKDEKISACGLLELVTSKKDQKKYYRLVVGYFDAYLNERREKEFIKAEI